MTKNKPKADDRTDNMEKLKDMVENTRDNMEAAEETMAFADGEELEAIREKNARREKSFDGFTKEILDEATARKKGYSQDQ